MVIGHRDVSTSMGPQTHRSSLFNIILDIVQQSIQATVVRYVEEGLITRELWAGISYYIYY